MLRQAFASLHRCPLLLAIASCSAGTAATEATGGGGASEPPGGASSPSLDASPPRDGIASPARDASPSFEAAPDDDVSQHVDASVDDVSVDIVPARPEVGTGTARGDAGRDAIGSNDAGRGETGTVRVVDSGASSDGANDPFVLTWQDDFNTLNAADWQLENFTFAGNLAQFTPQNATVANGILTLALTSAPSGSAQPYLGVEMRSTRTLTYGKLSARMRFATGSGVVSGLVLFYTPFPNCDWNEIDIEHLGNSSGTSQLNAMVYVGAPVPSCTTSVTPTQDPLITPLGFNAEADFHQYDVEWTPAGVRYLADGVLLRTWTRNIDLLRLPQTVLLTIWASSAAGWAGPVTPTSAPTTADVDWVKLYRWNG